MSFTLSARSEQRLTGLHSDLVAVVRLAAALAAKGEAEFIVTEGMRTKARQAQLVAAGASQTMNSRHLTGHAVDIAPVVGGQVRWDWPLFHRLSWAFKTASHDLKVPIVWGGDWSGFPDGPHVELDRTKYP